MRGASSRDEERALLAAVVAQPHEDGPRLVYADWLAERGDPRGEFISLQCALERSTKRSPPSPELTERARALLAAHRATWEPKLGPDFSWHFHRGFVWGVEATASQLLGTGASLLSTAPTLASVVVRRIDVDVEAWLAWPPPRGGSQPRHSLPSGRRPRAGAASPLE
jgi:uncharacterized protein (TIGR02996 family)